MKKRGTIIYIGKVPPPYGGVSIFNKNLLDHLKLTDVEIHLRKPGLDLLLTKSTVIIDSYNSIIESPTIINFIKYLPFFVRRFNWIKVVHYGGYNGHYNKFNSLEKAFVKLYLKRVTRLVCVSDSLADFFQTELDKSSEVIHSFLPISDKYKPGMQVATLMNMLSKTNKITLVGIGVFNSFYGFFDIVKAVEKLRNSGRSEIEVILIDGGFANDAEYERKCVSDKKWVHVLREIPPTDVYHVMKNANLFVRSVIEESLGLSKIEAIYLGCKVISTDSGYIDNIPTYTYGDINGLQKLIEQTLDSSIEDSANQKDITKKMQENLAKFTSLIYDATSKTG